MNHLPDLGLGILLAASLPVEALQRVFGCGPHEAETFKERAVADLLTIQRQIARARDGKELQQ